MRFLWKPFSLSVKHVVSRGERLLAPHHTMATSLWLLAKCLSTAGLAEAMLQALTALLHVCLL